MRSPFGLQVGKLSTPGSVVRRLTLPFFSSSAQTSELVAESWRVKTIVSLSQNCGARSLVGPARSAWAPFPSALTIQMSKFEPSVGPDR